MHLRLPGRFSLSEPCLQVGESKVIQLLDLESVLSWLLGYLVVGLLLAAAVLALLRDDEKKAVKPHEEAVSRGEAPWCFCRPPETIPRIPPHKFLLFSAVLVPELIYFAVRDLLALWKRKRREAWERSPAGQADLQRRVQQGVEAQIAPWVPVEWITEREIPWAEFEADYRDSINWAPLDRDAFALLWSRISETDEIGYFSTPPETWAHLCGRAGWVVLREGTVIGQLVIAMN